MVHFFSLPVVGLTFVVASNALLASRTTPPTSYAEGYLEDYDGYHKRYLQLGCNLKHNTPFFDLCCHPLLATESLDIDRAPECNPANQTSTTTVISPPTTSSPTRSATVPTTTHTTASSSTTPPPSSPPPPTSTTHPTSSASPPPPSGGDIHYGGFATYYYQHGIAGACGTVHPDSALIAALDDGMYGDTGKQSQYCGRKVQITNKNNGKQVTVVVADACPTCVNDDSIDLSTAAFNAIATEPEGMVPITWQFLD